MGDPPQTRGELRRRLLERYSALRAFSLRLAGTLSAEDQGCSRCRMPARPDGTLAHTSWFFETVILDALLPDYPPFDPRFRYFFNSLLRNPRTTAATPAARADQLTRQQ